MEVPREDVHQVLRHNSAWTLPGASELTTITALARQTSHDLTQANPQGFFQA